MKLITVKTWTIATFLGWLMGIFLLIALSGVLDSVGIENMQFYIGLGIGAGVGFTQWRVLKHTIGMHKIWWFSSMVCTGFPFFCFDVFRFFSGRSLGTWYIPVSILIGSALCGLVQQGALLRMGYRARTWMFVSVAGWTLGTLTVLSMDYLKQVSANNWVIFSINLSLILSGGIVLGIITGIPLRRMLSQS